MESSGVHLRNLHRLRSGFFGDFANSKFVEESITVGISWGHSAPFHGSIMVTNGPSRVLKTRDSILNNVTAGLSGDLLSSIANIALQTRLSSYDLVDTKINCSLGGLLAGKVERVQVLGLGWESPLKLTCRSLDVRVEDVQLDVAALMTRQQILLLRPPYGSASISFNGADFGNFLLHPLMTKASSAAIDSQAFSFVTKQVYIVDNASELHSNIPFPFVRFQGVWQENGKLYDIAMGVLNNNSAQVSIHVLSSGECCSSEDVLKVKVGLQKFFGSLKVELDGTFMQFSRLEFSKHQRKSGVIEPTMKLTLSVEVQRFPPPHVSF